MTKPPLFQQMIHSTTRILTKKSDGSRSIATGFFYNFWSVEKVEMSVPFLISNRHVLADAVEISIAFTEYDIESQSPRLGQIIAASIEKDEIDKNLLLHPNAHVDLAAIPIGPTLNVLHSQGRRPFYIAFGRKHTPTPDAFEHYQAVENIFMVGYPGGNFDDLNNVPIVRSGITATPPFIDFRGRPEFLLDIPCYQGSSGSPVFICHLGDYVDDRGQLWKGPRVILLGIAYATGLVDLHGDLIMNDQRVADVKSRVQSPNNIAFVAKSHLLLDFDRLYLAKHAEFGPAWEGFDALPDEIKQLVPFLRGS